VNRRPLHTEYLGDSVAIGAIQIDEITPKLQGHFDDAGQFRLLNLRRSSNSSRASNYSQVKISVLPGAIPAAVNALAGRVSTRIP
jgi:hypothetical protein